MPVVRQTTDWEKGEIIHLDHSSQVLKGNPWKDPVDRQLGVYLPPGYQNDSSPYIALWDLAAFTNSGPGHLSWRHHGENLPQRLDRLIAQEKIPPVVVVFPDCYTSLGGNQYLNSSSVGAYADYINLELVPLLSERVNVINDRSGRAAFGKSSGGYGALSLAMKTPEVWGGAASHAGDVGFDLVYRPEFPLAATTLAMNDGDINRFLTRFWNNRKRGKADYATLMTIAMAASYDPDEKCPEIIRLPFDIQSCQLIEERWNKWLDHDLLNMIERYSDALKSLSALYLDAGNRDQYNIQFGTRQLSQRLEKLGVNHHFEEFEGSHSGMDFRLDVSLPLLANALYLENTGST